MNKFHCPNKTCGSIVSDTLDYCNKCGYNISSLLKRDELMFDLACELKGKGNHEDAVYFYTRCAKLGNFNAMYELGKYYEGRYGILKNFKWAVYCMKKAVKHNHIDAICWLAEAFEYGKETIKPNLLLSLNLYKAAYDLGKIAVKNKIDDLSTEIDYSNFKKDNFYENSDDESYNNDYSDFDLEDLNDDHEISQLHGLIMKKQFSKHILTDNDKIIEEETNNLVENINKISKDINNLNNRKVPMETYDFNNSDMAKQIQFDKGYNKNINKRINELEIAIDSPYIGRMNVSVNNGEILDIYVGKKMVVVDGNVLVYSWDSPLGNKIYDNHNTNYCINVIDKLNNKHISNYNLKFRRKIDIENRKLLKVVQDYSENSGFGAMIYDEFLLHILEKKKNDYRLTDIIPSIQRNQNEIITRPLNENLIVQGCAGSGKTMILLHRLRYLKTNEDIDFNSVRILTPSERFNTHINSLCNDLELLFISKTTVQDYYFNKLLEYDTKWKKYVKNKTLCDDRDLPLEIVNYYYSDTFITDLEQDWKIISEEYKEQCAKVKEAHYEKLKDWEVKKKKYDSTPVTERPNNPPKKPNLSFPLINILNGLFKKLKPEYKSNNNTIYRCELYASLLITFKMCGAKSKEKMILIDEGQDLSINELMLMRIINDDKVLFNIYGDTNQLINRDKGITDWNYLEKIGDFSQYELHENYRSTKEITEYINNKLNLKMTSLGIDGNKVMEINESDLISKLNNESSTKRIAIIYKTINNSFKAKVESIKTNRDNIVLLNVVQAKGLEFDTVYAILEDMTEYEMYIALTRALSILYVIVNISSPTNQ